MKQELGTGVGFVLFFLLYFSCPGKNRFQFITISSINLALTALQFHCSDSKKLNSLPPKKHDFPKE